MLMSIPLVYRAALLGCTAVLLTACGAEQQRSAPVQSPMTTEQAVPAADDNQIADDDVAKMDGGDEHDDHAEHADGDAHDDHDEIEGGHGGGEAHVHGGAEMAITVDGNTLSASIDSPLSNFGLSEAAPTTDAGRLERTEFASAAKNDGIIISIIGGDCSLSNADVEFRQSGDHGSVLLDYAYTCARIGAIEGVDFVGFSAYPAMERVDAVYLEANHQSAATMTPDSTTFEFD